MNRKYKSLSISLISIFFLCNLLINSNIIIDNFFQTIKLCFNNLLPTIFLFFILTDILNNYNFPYYLSMILGKLIGKTYKLPKISSYIIFMSMTSGFPGNSKLIKEQLDNHAINEYDATKLLTMTHFSNPLFIIYTIGNNVLHDTKISIIILIVHFSTNFLIGFLFRNIYQINENNNNLKPTNPLPFMELLKKSIYNTAKILTQVFGIIIVINTSIATINQYLNLNLYSHMLLNGLMEITNGLGLLNLLSLSKIKAAIIATFFISFGGFSIHMQVMSILNKYKINYYIYLLARILHAAISSIIVFLILIYC